MLSLAENDFLKVSDHLQPNRQNGIKCKFNTNGPVEAKVKDGIFGGKPYVSS
jgi:hypothetical protein